VTPESTGASARGEILLVEDRDSLRQMLRLALEVGGHRVLEASDEPDAIRMLQRHRPALVLTDLKLPRGDGFGVLRAAKAVDPQMPVVLLTAYGAVPDVVRAMKEGALDFLAKPVDPDHLRLIVSRALAERRLATENLLLREELGRRRGVPEIVGDHESIRAALGSLRRAATSDTTVLLTGESGTGKELFARALHALSDRRDGPFVAVNCAAIPETLLESELFGHERGAFTGAITRRPGRFEIAHGGTLFLDEVAELPLPLQPKVLRALQEQTFDRLGGSAPIQVDVRVVAATNRDLLAMLAAGTFREDLFFRLDVFRVRIPALRDRASDVPLLAETILRRTAAELNKPVPALSPGALDRLVHYPWPGNVRELENCLERALILAEGATIEPVHLNLPTTPLQVRTEAAAADPWDQIDLSGTLDDATRRVVLEVERRKIAKALQETNDDALKAAELLGMAPRLLVKKIRSLGLMRSSRAI
jgi:DNA-binding NtrC family response regulator